MKYIILFMLIAFSFQAHSQSDKQIINIGNQILLKGKVTDEFTGKPVGTDIEFKDATGKKIKTLSNSLTGNWEQLLPEGKFEVLLFSWNIARKVENIEIEAGTKYKEEELNFVVRRMIPGDKVLKLKAFAENEQTIVASSISELESLRELMRFNRGVEFVIYVSAAEMDAPINDEPKPEPAQSKKTKGKKKAPAAAPKPKVEAKPDYTILINQRIESLKAIIDSWGSHSKRIRIEADFNNKHTSFPENLWVVVEKNEDVFNR